MRLFILIFISVLMGASVALAEQSPSCVDTNFEYMNLTAKELRSIAATCHSGELSQLYYNRAYHADLVEEGKTLSELIAYYSRGVEHHFEAYRLYIALIETMSPIWYPNPKDRVTFLNKEYEQRGEVAELRLHGYDRLADAKERQFTPQ